MVVLHRVVKLLPQHLSVISEGRLHWNNIELEVEVHRVTTGTLEQMVNSQSTVKTAQLMLSMSLNRCSLLHI